MKIVMMMLLFVGPVFCRQINASDTKDHFYGSGTVTFKSYGRICHFTAEIEVKSPAMWTLFFERAFSYTLRNLTPVTPEDARCHYPDYGQDFIAICRAFSMSDGSIGVDVPTFGMIQVLPKNPDVRAIFSQNAQNGSNWGFDVTRLWYRLTVLPDGGLQVLAYIPQGWNPKDFQ